MHLILLWLCRYALNEMDKFSLKDSGRGDSEAGDSDYEPGRESPVDRLLGEAFTELYSPDGQHCSHAGTTLSTTRNFPTVSTSNPGCIHSIPKLNPAFPNVSLKLEILVFPMTYTYS